MSKRKSKTMEQRKPQDLALPMKEETFECWMESIMPQMVQLSPKQTEAFFLHFLDNCTWKQKRFLETEFPRLLKRDLMKLPDLIVIKLLKMLDVRSVLNLRLVSLSWKEKIDSMTWFWKAKCQQCLFLPADDGRSYLVPYNVEFFLHAQRALRQMTAGTGFEAIRRGLSMDALKDPSLFHWREPHVMCYCPVNNVIVAGAADMHLRAYDAHRRSYGTLWMEESITPSCLYISSDLVLAGNHFGQVRVLTVPGKLLDNAFQCGSCSVSTLDVHPSGLFMMVATADRCLHLVDSELEVYYLSVLPDEMSDSLIRKVFFLPDACLLKNQLAVFVCTDYGICVALLDTHGRVLKKETLLFSHKAFTFCRDINESNVFYKTSNMSASCPPPPNRITKNTVQVSSEGISFQAVHTPTRFTDNILLLAVGRELAIACVSYHVYAFTLSQGITLFCVPDFLDTYPVSRLMLEAQLGRVIVPNVDWLNGLTPDSMPTDAPVLSFGTTNPKLQYIGPMVKSLFWSPDLWGSFSRTPEEKKEPFVDSTCSDSDKRGTVNGHASSAVGTEGLPNYRMCCPLGPWRNAALFEQKVKKKKTPVSTSPTCTPMFWKSKPLFS